MGAVKQQPFGASLRYLDARAEAKEDYAELLREKDQRIAALAERVRKLESVLAQYEGMSVPQPARRSRTAAKSRRRAKAQPVLVHQLREMWSVEHTCLTTGLSQSTVSRRITRREIEAERIGGVYYIPAAIARALNRKAKRGGIHQ